jgi:hypothetical protein
MRPRTNHAILIVLLLAGAAWPRPMEVAPSEWPLDRIVENLERVVKETPNDGEAHYYLGRALGFAFALERSTLWTIWEAAELVSELDEQQAQFGTSARSEQVTPAESLERLASGILHLRRACEIEAVPEELERERQWSHDWCVAREHLTFAWLLETGAHLADRVPTLDVLGVESPALTPDGRAKLERWIVDLGSSDLAVASSAQKALATPINLERAIALLVAQVASPNARRQLAAVELIRRYWIERAVREYAIAYEQNIQHDLSPDWHDVELDSLLSYEALLGYERLVQRRGVQNPEEELLLASMAEKRPQLEAHSRERAFITPLLLSLDECRTLDELIAPNLAVPFDLDGDAVDELWPWIAPGTGWLVWDPERRGEITSGRQLFGSASAWLFFENGYRVLDALDDDRDGELRRAELTGIAVWFDRDLDGISDRGEVVPVEELGIVALATEATLALGSSPANLCGLELADGRVLPSYDWVLESVSEEEPASHPAIASAWVVRQALTATAEE